MWRLTVAASHSLRVLSSDPDTRYRESCDHATSDMPYKMVQWRSKERECVGEREGRGMDGGKEGERERRMDGWMEGEREGGREARERDSVQSIFTCNGTTRDMHYLFMPGDCSLKFSIISSPYLHSFVSSCTCKRMNQPLSEHPFTA